MTTPVPSRTSFSSSAPHPAPYIVYINGIEVPAKSVSLRFGVWQIPEMQIEMVADPALARLGAQDRIQVAVFYLDDTRVSTSVPPAFRMFGEGEITGWGYRNTSGGRSIVFTVINQIAVFTQLFVDFLTTVDDMIASATDTRITTIANPSSSLVYPFALFTQGLVPGTGRDAPLITRPFDFVYNVVKGMIGSQVPTPSQTVPASNFFARWARLTNFHNRFVGTPSFDEISDNANIFPVLRAVQAVSAADVITKNLIPQIQNAGSILDMLQVVYSTMLMELAMIPSMPLVTVSLVSNLIQETNFAEHTLRLNTAGVWVPTLSIESRKTSPKRIPNYFAKPQMLFAIPPSCNVIFPSQLKTIAYDENYATQPTRMYFNDKTLTNVLQTQPKGLVDTIHNALVTAYPPQANLIAKEQNSKQPLFNGKNFLLYPEEFFKGPVMEKRDIPPWLFFLKAAEIQKGIATTQAQTADGAQTPVTPVPAGVTTPAPQSGVPHPGGTMVTVSNNGKQNTSGGRTFDSTVESLRDKVKRLNASFTGNTIPVDFILCWINMESDGSIKEIDTSGGPSNNTAGYFQLNAANISTVKSPWFPGGITASQLRDPNDDISITGGLAFILKSRGIASQIATNAGLSWSDGDMWRLTKLCQHGISASSTSFEISKAAQVLGHPPVDWSEFYNAVMPTPPVGVGGHPAQIASAINNATACGGVVPGASGTMVSRSVPAASPTPAASPAPATPQASASISTSPQVTPNTPVTPATVTTVNATVETVYDLYAKFEYFRERFAKRSGSATIAWNPYVVPGFPGMIFDNRASSVDIACYITTVQQMMSHDGQRNTTLSYIYGRHLQEMFQLMVDDFAVGDPAAGAGPPEPVRDVRKIVQSFTQAETFYKNLFYGGQTLFGKAASFDFRNIVGYPGAGPNDPPIPIIVDGPDEASQDAVVSSTIQLQKLLAQQTSISSQVLNVQNMISNNENIVTMLSTSSDVVTDDAAATVPTPNAQALADAQTQLTQLDPLLRLLTAQLGLINAGITAAQATIAGNAPDAAHAPVVVTLSNLDPTQPVVPRPSAQAMFNSYDAAMIYNWRPICSLDEYIVFYNSGATGQIPAFGHPRSVGARFFDQIRTITPPAPGFVPPTGADGLGGPSVPGLTNVNFPQVAADWTSVLLAYKDRVLNRQAPRV